MVKYEIFRKTSLSIIVPCYNEERTIEACLRRLIDIQDDKLSIEIIVVDDKSSDRTLDIIKKISIEYPEIIILKHDKNNGKGAAIRTGLVKASAEVVAIQDADLEYNPLELRRLINPIIMGDADAVYGSRFITLGERRVLFFWHTMGNKFLTFLSNMFTNLNLSDMETCYKLIKRDVFEKINIEENRFGFEPEITAKLAHMRARIYEMGISYHARTYEEGKKINWKDGLWTLYCVFKYNLINR